MKPLRLISAAAAICLSGALLPAHATPADLKKSAELLEKHYYESAAAMLRAGKFAGDTEPMAALTLGRAYARSAELHRALHEASIALGTRYLQQLVTHRGKDASRYAPLYYGEYLIEARKTKEGTTQLRRFLEQKDTAAPYADLAKVIIAAGDAAPGIGAVKSVDPLVRLQAAAALSRHPEKRAEALATADQAIDTLRKTHAALPMRAVTQAVGIYARGAQHDKALALLAAGDASRPSMEETVATSKVLRHYDPALLKNLAELYDGAAEKWFDTARQTPRIKAVAAYFLAELHFAAGRTNKAGALLAEIAAAPELPAAFRERTAILRAAVEARGTEPLRAAQAFDELAKKHAQDPILMAETLLACVRTQAQCPATIAAARALAQSAQSDRFRALHRAVGEQYAAEGKSELALQSLETARDKSNKNKLDTNDPLLLLRLAEQHFAAKSFSESLEIYFELGKEFPAVRQLQEAAQGIYSTEYRSAGDVRIF
jgi:hypothetical protein